MKTVLFTASYLIEVEDELYASREYEDFSTLVFQKLAGDKRKMIDDTHSAKWTSSSLAVLDPNYANCGKCSNCGGWTTDREKENPIEGLSNGATVEGLLLCDECLPKGHRWAF